MNSYKTRGRAFIIVIFYKLLDKGYNTTLVDSTYLPQEDEQIVLANDLENFTMLKAHRNNPLSKKDLIYNKRVSRIRVRVEHVFAKMKAMGAGFYHRIELQRNNTMH